MSDVLGGGELGKALASMEYSAIPNVLADRYGTDPMKRIWSPQGSIIIERFIQIEIMRAQADLGVDIPGSAIEDYEQVALVIDTDSILERERKSKHDVEARIAEFNGLAGHQYVGLAMTSRDHTEPTEQFQKRLALELIRSKSVAAIAAFASAAAAYSELPITARTHNVPAQMTTLGKRLSMSGEEMIDGYNSLSEHIDGLKFRGIKGAVGTQQDMLDLFGGDESKVDELDQRLAKKLGFNHVYNSVGQIYPRSQDLASIQALGQVAAPISNFSLNVRLMQGAGLMTESTKRRVGSNAMPHKINPRTAERDNALWAILGGFEFMLRTKAGEQWLEGSVDDSAIRRVALEGSFFATDGEFESGLTVLNGFGLFRHAIAAEVETNLPFLATTKVLTQAIKRGMGREDAHRRIRDHAFAVVEDMRERGLPENDLLQRLGNDENIPMSYPEIIEAIESPIELTGRARTQVKRFLDEANDVISARPEAASYKERDIL